MSSATVLFGARARAEGWRAGPAYARGIRSGLFRLFRRGRPMTDFGWGAVLLAFLTAQRLAELLWARRNERQLLAAGGVEYGKPHLPLIIRIPRRVDRGIMGAWLRPFRRGPYFSRCSSACRSRGIGSWLRWPALDHSHYRGPRRKAGDAWALSISSPPQLRGRDRRDRRRAIGAGPADLRPRLLHSQRYCAGHPVPG